MTKKHCPKCTASFYIGRPSGAVRSNCSVCPECRLAFNHAEANKGTIRCWVGQHDDHKYLVGGEFIPAGKSNEEVDRQGRMFGMLVKC
jgi:hypothetical protein